MKDILFYHSYNGNEPYIFLLFDKSNRRTAYQIVNRLIERQFRICYHEHDNRVLADSDGLAERMISSALTIFLISAESLQSLAFRNCINYALSKKKRIFCIFLDDETLEYGFEMQLTTVPGVKSSGFKNASELSESILKTQYFNQDMRGDDAKIPIKSNRKKKAVLGIMASILILFFVSAAALIAYRIHYDSSFAGQVEKLTETDYLDVSNKDASVIELLKDKSIRTLVARNMGLTDIGVLQYVDCEELDLSQNPRINSLEPLLENKNLKILRVTQDMYPAIIRISGNHPFKIIVAG